MGWPAPVGLLCLPCRSDSPALGGTGPAPASVHNGITGPDADPGCGRLPVPGCAALPGLGATRAVPEPAEPAACGTPAASPTTPPGDRRGHRMIVVVHTKAWVWDETLYAGSAPHYGTGRMPYPPSLIEVVRR